MSSPLSHRALLSQNFLKDSRLVASLLDRLDLGSDSVVYEIGPGEGIITEQLARRYRKVVAIEKDSRLAERLRQRYRGQPHVTIHSGDFLRHPLPHISYKVFANIPFNTTSAIVTKLTEAERPPEDAYLVMQREAAEMFLGRPRESLRSVLLKPWFDVTIVHRFRRADFLPAPRVDVVMLRLRKRGPPLVTKNDRQCFRDFVVYVFTHWQPHRCNPLNDFFTHRQMRAIERELVFDHTTRQASLTIGQWLSLFEHLKAHGDTGKLRDIAGSEKRLRQQQEKLDKVHRTRVAGGNM